ncbi:hypothetical protein ACH5RR_026140 [Cinchona calisaya]|uniref:Uncharacterized protein n=1 Tax=Cinchona calisaya TaxID=153742 RepID=A0ABD2Z6P5_9GENT
MLLAIASIPRNSRLLLSLPQNGACRSYVFDKNPRKLNPNRHEPKSTEEDLLHPPVIAPLQPPKQQSVPKAIVSVNSSSGFNVSGSSGLVAQEKSRLLLCCTMLHQLVLHQLFLKNPWRDPLLNYQL